jgi:hypothetical protein
MKRVVFLMLGVVALVSICVSMAPAFGQGSGGGTAIYVTKMPPGYRDWKLISLAHEAGNLNSFAAVLGNDLAYNAFHDGKLTYPDGSIIAALHYGHVPSDENNKVFGQVQSFVPGAPTNTQFMIKDSKKYAATGGWGYGHFNKDGSVGNETLMKTCAPCHAMASRDGVFARYAP